MIEVKTQAELDKALAKAQPGEFELGEGVIRRWWGADANAVSGADYAHTTFVQTDDPRFLGLGEVLAVEASEHPLVRRWRERYLDGSPVGEHEWQAVLVRLREIPPSSAPAGAPEAGQPGFRLPTPAELPKQRWLLLPGGTREPVHAGAPLGELADLIDKLTDWYYWLPSDAFLFVVAERAPPYYPIIAHLRAARRAASSRITLSIDPRTPAREVVRAYKEKRASDIFGGKPLAQGETSRRLDEKTARLAVLLAENLGASWPARLAKWNESYPGWRYNGVRPLFESGARRAWRRVVGSDLRPNEAALRERDLRSSAFFDIPPGVISQQNGDTDE